MIPASSPRFAPAARLLGTVLRPHAADASRDTLFQEEARAERLANLMRAVYLAVWLSAALVYAPDNDPAFNRINLGVGGAWMGAALLLHARLAFRGYHPALKYASTTFDMFVSTVFLLLYAAAQDPVYALKMPIVLNYFCCLGLAALRFRPALAAYAAATAVAGYLATWGFLEITEGVAYGDSIGHAYAGRVHFDFLVDTGLYLLMFGVLTVVAAFNARRLVTLRVAEGERAAREEERALMAAGLAHEIRNPLGGIYGAAQVLRERAEWLPRFVDMILADARRLNGVVEGFLRYARPFPVRPAAVDVAALAEEFAREQSRLHPDVAVDCARETPSASARTDREAVLQILLNLVRNARRVQPPGRAVLIRVGERAGHIEVRVEDDGPGVPESARSHLFIPFRSGHADGNGIGLAISRRMARALGGELEYVPGRSGACFVLRIPHARIPA